MPPEALVPLLCQRYTSTSRCGSAITKEVHRIVPGRKPTNSSGDDAQQIASDASRSTGALTENVVPTEALRRGTLASEKNDLTSVLVKAGISSMRHVASLHSHDSRDAVTNNPFAAPYLPSHPSRPSQVGGFNPISRQGSACGRVSSMNVEGFLDIVHPQSRLPGGRCPPVISTAPAPHQFCELTEEYLEKMNERRSCGQDEIEELEVRGVQMAAIRSLQEQRRHARSIQMNDQALELGFALSIQEFQNYCRLEEQRRNQIRVLKKARQGFGRRLRGAEQQKELSSPSLSTDIPKPISYLPDHQRGNLKSLQEQLIASSPQEMRGQETEGLPTTSVLTPYPRDIQGNLQGSDNSISESDFERLLDLWDETPTNLFGRWQVFL